MHGNCCQEKFLPILPYPVTNNKYANFILRVAVQWKFPCTQLMTWLHETCIHFTILSHHSMTSLSYLELTSSLPGLTDKPSLFRRLCSYTYNIMHTFIAMHSTIFQYLDLCRSPGKRYIHTSWCKAMSLLRALSKRAPPMQIEGYWLATVTPFCLVGVTPLLHEEKTRVMGL